MATVQVIITGAVLFILYRYLLRTLGADHVGIWSVALATASVLRISELGLAGGATKFLAAANAKDDFRKAAEVVETTVLTIAITLAIALIVGYPLICLLLGKIVPPTHLPTAIEIIPYALVSVWLMGAGGVIHVSLDGCQRADLRASVAMVAVVLYLLLVYLLIPPYGLIGLGLAQIIQAFFIMVASWILLRREISALSIVPFRWRIYIFQEMLLYGASFQLISIFSMLFEPLTKAFLTKFGSLSATTYFEMANRMVTQFRALVVSANQVLVPKIAAVQETSPGQILQIYRDSYRAVFFLIIPLFSLLIVATPLIGLIWIGFYEPNFVFFGVILVLGYLINTLSVPAYFMNLGIGSLRWNVISHMVLGLFVATLGYTFGVIAGGRGVVIGTVTALTLSSAIIILGTHKDHKISYGDLLPNESLLILFIACGSIVIEMLFTNNLIHNSIILLITFVALLPAIWLHPMRIIMWNGIVNNFKCQ